jgi:hypothetical protein
MLGGWRCDSVLGYILAIMPSYIRCRRKGLDISMLVRDRRLPVWLAHNLLQEVNSRLYSLSLLSILEPLLGKQTLIVYLFILAKFKTKYIAGN